MKIGDKIKIGNLDGKTDNKGTKQNKQYTITGISTVIGFYDAVDDKGRIFTIWMLNESGSLLSMGATVGVKKAGQMRMTYTKEFQVIETL